jgi:lysozyme family protein
MGVTAFGAVTAMSVPAFASAASTVDITGAITTGIASIQTQAFSAIGAVAPVAVSIVGAVMGVRIAIRALRSVVG